jgi:hypothetical protein
MVNVDTIETTVSSSGNIRGMQVTQVLTFVGRPPSEGVLHGIGMGMTMAGGLDVATFTGEAVGRSGSSGSISWRGSIL